MPKAIVYDLSISCVDGEAFYGLTTNDVFSLRPFLDKYNHEGSTLSLEVLLNRRLIALGQYEDADVCEYIATAEKEELEKKNDV